MATECGSDHPVRELRHSDVPVHLHRAGDDSALSTNGPPGEARRSAAALHGGLPGELGEAIRIRSLDGRDSGWFVPARLHGRLVGFHQLREDLSQLRWAQFDQDASLLSWTDPATVRVVAEALLQAGEHADEPFLSYDGVVDKLAWAVPVLGPDPNTVILVAGDAAWRVSAPTTSTDSTG